MTETISITLQGVAELNRALAELNRNLPERVAKMALRQGANGMLKNIRAAAPKKTGRLRRAIKVKSSKINRVRNNGKVGVFISITPGKSRNDPKGAYYGPFQEYGYTATGRTKGTEVTFTRTTRAQRQAYKQRTGRRLRIYSHRPEARKIPGRHFIANTFAVTKEPTAQTIASAMEIAARQLAQSIGFNINR